MRNASNEVDCEIAEKVLGAVWKESGEGIKKLYLKDKAIATSFPSGETRRSLDSTYNLPHYSDSIQDAWTLIAHFDEQTTDFSIEKSGLNWTASNTMCSATALSPQLAICIWALEMAKLKTA